VNSYYLYQNPSQFLSSFMKRPPTAWAFIQGSEKYPSVRGTVRFYQMLKNVLVIAEINGLPEGNAPCGSPVFAFHIHDGNSCDAPRPNPNPPILPRPTPNPPAPPRPNPNPPAPPRPNPPTPPRPTPNPPAPTRPNPNPPTPPSTAPNSEFRIPNSELNSAPFPQSGTHYNPNNCPHPYHAGDMPPLFGADGYAFLSFVTSRFTANEVIGKTIIIHSQPDDFKTQPSGDSGEKIACGVITPILR